MSNKLSRKKTETLLIGSRTASSIRRAGGENLRLEGENIAVILGRGHTRATTNLVNETRPELTAFLEFEAEHGPLADQTLALMAADDLLHGDQHDPGEMRILAIAGMAGSGKTHLAATIIKNELARTKDPRFSIRVAAPSNRAVAVLDARLKSLGVDDDRVLCTTAHRAFKTLEMTAVGETIVTAIAKGRTTAAVPAGVSNYDVAADLIDEAFRNYSSLVDAKYNRVRDMCQAAIDSDGAGEDRIIAKIGARAMQLLGYGALDERFVCWSDTPEPADLFIVDEASMIGLAMIKRASAMAPTILLGDTYQLPPVKLMTADRYGGMRPDTPALSAVPANRTVTLQRSRRTAEASLIPRVAAGALYLRAPDIVADLPLYAGEGEVPEVCKIRDLGVLPKEILASDCAALAYTNRKRIAHNRSIRRLLDRPVNAIVVGDRLVVSDAAEGIRLKTGGSTNIARDTLAQVVAVHRDPSALEALYEFDLELLETGTVVRATLGYWDQATPQGDKQPLLSGVQNVVEPWAYDADLLVAFAQSVTTHKAQGSAFRTVILDLNDMTRQFGEDGPRLDNVEFEDGSYPESWRRLCYTAATRASERLIILTGH